MACKATRSRAAFNLLDLPDAAISTIIASLATADKENLMAASRTSFKMTMLAAAEITFRVTNDATFAGIKQVLDFFPRQLHLEVLCPSLHQGSLMPGYQKPLSALATIMGMVPENYLAQVAFSCHWESITRVTIQGTQLRCLIPQFLALACPNLTQLKIKSTFQSQTFSHEPTNAVPLYTCSSLKHLEIDHDYDYQNNQFELPPAYHSPEELRHILPNLDTLILALPNEALIQAFATQLRTLDITQFAAVVEQPIRQCINLEHLRIDEVILPENADSLSSLEIGCELTDGDMAKLLRLPNLSKLSCPGFSGIGQDWSGHACSWQELHIGCELLEIMPLSNLNLKNLKKLCMYGDRCVKLPDPSNPNNLAAVRRIADSLSGVGQVTWASAGATCCEGYGLYEWRCDEISSSSDHQQAAADMITALAPRFAPGEVCVLEFLLGSPLVIRAVLDWGHTCIERVCLGHKYDAPSNIWGVLQQLPKLTTVVFWNNGTPFYIPESESLSTEEELAQHMLNIASVVRDAVQHYVIPPDRRLCMEFGMNCVEGQCHTLTEQGLLFLRSAIQNFLPAGIKLESLKRQCREESPSYAEYYNQYGIDCDAAWFWVIILEPIPSKA